MKKLLIRFIALLTLACVVLPSAAFAQTSMPSSSKSLKALSINYATMVGHEGRSYDALIQELLNDGLSQSDAEYYAKLDIFAYQTELQNIDVNSGLKDVQPLSDQFARINPDEVRERALNLDPSALKTILNQNEAMVLGHDDANDIIKTISETSNGYCVTIEYPDGSKCVMSSN